MWKRALLALLALAYVGPAVALDLQSTTAPGRSVPSLTNGEIAINRADRTLFFKNVDGTIGSGALMNATTAGRQAVEQGDASALSARPTAGSISRTLKDLLSNEVYAANYGAVPDDGLDDGPAIRQAILIAQQRRARLRLPGGVLNVCTDPADAEALLRITSVMELAGASRGTTIMPCATAGDRAVVLVKPPASAGGIRGAVLRDFTIGVLGQTRFGGDGIKIDTTNKFGFVAKLLVENVSVADAGAGKYSFRHINIWTDDGSGGTADGNKTGGLFASTIRDNDFFGGMKLTLTGDSNNIERNIITGPNEGIYYEAINTGAATHRIVGNNITASGDTIYLKGGQQIKILENQLESVGAYTGSQSSPATIVVDGTADWVIRNNNINAYTRNDVVLAINNARSGRLEPNSVNYASSHFLYRAVGSPGNIVERQLYELIDGVSSAGRSLVSVDAASVTLGVWQQLTLQNGWVVGSDATFRQGIWWMPLPDGTIRLSGAVRPGSGATVSPGTAIATFPAGYRVTNKASRLLVTGFSSGSFGQYSVVLNLAGGITIETAAPAGFYQFDGISFSIRP